MNLESLLREAAQKERYRPGVAASDLAVHALEVSLGVTLPRPYRSFLFQVGYVRWFGCEVFGITGDEQNDAYLRTKAEREHSLRFRDQVFQFPKHATVIGEIFGGGYSLLHAVESTRAGQVSAHSPDEAYQEVQYWRSFEDYFEYLVAKPNHLCNWHRRNQGT